MATILETKTTKKYCLTSKEIKILGTNLGKENKLAKALEQAINENLKLGFPNLVCFHIGGEEKNILTIVSSGP